MKIHSIYIPKLTKKHIKLNIKKSYTKKNIKLNLKYFKNHINKIKTGDNTEHYVKILSNKILIKNDTNKLIKSVNKFKEVIISHHSFENFRNVESLLSGIKKTKTDKTKTDKTKTDKTKTDKTKTDKKQNNNNSKTESKKGFLGLKFEECIILKNGETKLITWNIDNKFLDTQNIVLILEKKTTKGYKYIYINNNIKEFYFPERIIFISLGTNNAYNYPYMLSKSYFINLEFIYIDKLLYTYWAIKDCLLKDAEIYPIKKEIKTYKPLGLLGLDYFKYNTTKTIIDSSKVIKLF